VHDTWIEQRGCNRGLQKNDQLHCLSSWVFEPSDVRWEGHVTANTQNGNAYRVFVWKLVEKSDSFEHLRLGGRTKIKCKVNTVNFNL